MFVLLFGLMGVAAVFPVGNHYAGQGEQYDRGAALAEAGFADLKARGMLRPEVWHYASRPAADAQVGTTPSPVMRPAPNFDFNVPLPPANNTGPGYAFVLDPQGTAAGLTASPPITAGLDYFPYIDLAGASTPEGIVNRDMPEQWKASAGPSANKPGLLGDRWPLRRISLLQPPGALLTPQVAAAIFRLHDDASTELPTAGDRPGIQRWRTADPNNTPDNPADDTLLARDYSGSYSWLATIVPATVDGAAALQPVHWGFGSELYEVSVAVFHKREETPEVATERAISAALNVGGELVLYAPRNNVDMVDAAVEDLRVGQYIALAGVHPTTGQFLLKWYRLLSLDEETAENQAIDGVTSGSLAVRRAMIDGPDWPMADNPTVNDLRAIILPGVISVATEMLPTAREDGKASTSIILQ